MPFCDTTTLVGQGSFPDVWVLYATDDASSSIPTWTDATVTTRAFSTARGRNSEVDRVDAGTAQITVDATNRVVDPFQNPAIRPMNRWWLRSQFSGITEDIFKGYAEAYDTVFPGAGMAEALTIVSCVDEFKPLTLGTLPTTDPPRDSYQELVLFDKPDGYWPMDNDALSLAQTATVGESFVATSSTVPLMDVGEGDGAIVGQEPSRYVILGGTNFLWTKDLSRGESGDPGYLEEYTVEGWFRRRNSLPGAAEWLVIGASQEYSGPASIETYELKMTAAGEFEFKAKDNTNTQFTVTSNDIIDLNRWYHVVGTIEGGNIRIYVDGIEHDSTAWSGAFNPMLEDVGNALIVGNAGTSITGNVDVDELATYRYGLTAARVFAHYTAGNSRGFAIDQLPGDRINAVLDAAASDTPRLVRQGTRAMTGAYMRAQPPLEELRQAETADSVDAVLFVAKDGTVTFLDDGHRSVSPWNTVQATFDDDGTDLPYLDLGFDYSDAFLATQWNVTRLGGLTETATDSASESAFGPRPAVPKPPDLTRREFPGGTPSRPEIPIRLDADAAAIAAAMLAKYKNPFTRITSLTVNTAVAAVAEAVLALDIGDRIRVFKTHPGGGSRIDQTLFIQRVAVTAQNDQQPWQIVFGVSPL